MIRLTALFLALGLSGAGVCQSVPSLGDAQAVGMMPTWVQWSPSGGCLGYRTDDESGAVICLYEVGSPKGVQVLHLKKGELSTFQWFQSLDAAIVTVSGSDSRSRHLSVYLLEGKAGSATKVFDETTPQPLNLSIDAVLSPSLEHAIFNLHGGDVDRHLVLPAGGSTLIPSTDLDDAAKIGAIGPKWASTGTAFYMNVSNGQNQQGGVVTLSGNGGQPSTAIFLMNLQMNEFANSMMGAPPVGTVGYELSPDNGVLRQVKSPGPWQDPAPAELAFTPNRHPAEVTAGRFSARSESLWATSIKDKSLALMVAPSADKSWLSPNGHAIAYTVDGALFVRTLNY